MSDCILLVKHFLNFFIRFIEVASKKYIDTLDVEKRDEIFTNVIDFFTEKWKNTPKPFKHR